MKSNRYKFITTVAISAVLSINMIWAYSNNPPNARTGAPGENTCTGCHSTFGLNSGPGSVTIPDLPATYMPGETYTLTVMVDQVSQQRWGFELSPRTDDNTQGGTLGLTQSQWTQISNSGGVQFLKQNSTGTFSGQPDGAAWQFEWTAPAEGSGAITFYAAGNAANGNNNTSGDYIYNDSFLIEEDAGGCTADGDVNLDTSVDVLDVVSVVGFILGTVPFDDDQFCAGDVNEDMSIDVLDVVQIVGFILA